MQPNRAGRRRLKGRWLAPQAFGKPPRVSPVAGTTIKEIEYKEWKRGDADGPIKDCNESALNLPATAHGRDHTRRR